jgi:dolichol-phosphate mannosyltransferase
VNTGSSSEYGFQDHPPAETEPLEPNSHYAITKVAATLFCRYTARSSGAHIPTLRLYSVYGPYEEPTRLLPTLLVRGLRGALPPLVDPDVARDYVYVGDVVDAYLLAATVPNQEVGAIYNVGSSSQTTLREVVDLARRSLGITAAPRWGTLPNRQWDTTVWVADTQRVRSALGWQPRHSLERGFQQFVAWYHAHPALHAHYEQAALPL